ncbi:MAG TPA: hypothetical protein PLU53_01780 [Bacteroidia bacterium]|nr:hypothetical protein [Bacteroidia bacterium]
MTNLLTEAKSDYLLQTGISELHYEVTQWINEIEFYKTELFFLNKLLDRYLLRISNSEKVNAMLDLEKKVKSFRTGTLKKMIAAITEHEAELAKLDDNDLSQDEQRIREEHKEHKLAVKELAGNVKKLKIDIFSFVENLVKQTAKPKTRK